MDFAIRTDFRAILDVLIALNDNELDNEEKFIVVIQIIYKEWEKLPENQYEEAIKKAFDFIDCGQKDDGKVHPKLIDWEEDANIIIPAVNKVAHTEVRGLEYLHWWTFIGYYMEIGECLFSSVVNIRQKRAKHKKLEKYEQEFYRENKAIIDFASEEKRSEEEQKALDELFG